MATDAQVKAAIENYKADPSKLDAAAKKLVTDAAKQQGETGNKAKEALGQKTTGLLG